MSSKRKRTSNRSLCPQEIIEAARKRISDGESKRSLAKELGMAESTLRLRLSRPHSVTSLGRYDTTFSKEVEDDFCEYLKKLDNMFFGMTAKDLRIVAFEYAEKNNISHRFNPESKMFMKRHPDISLRRPTSTSIARAMGFNMPQCERFFINLTILMDKYNFSPNNIYNMDETGISSVPNNPPKVITTKGKRAVNKISSAERGTNVTVVSAMSATGHFLPPAFIFRRKRMKAELLDGSPPGSIARVSDTSYINANLFLVWLSHFKDHVKPTKEKPVILILDNHASHITIGAIDYYRENNIIALTLPPHSSHKLQPLDRGFHVALKRFYSNECEKWLRNNPGRTITVFQMCKIFTPSFLKAATPACAAESFKTTGIWPYNPDVFSEADFLASFVTERENELEFTAPQESRMAQIGANAVDDDEIMDRDAVVLECKSAAEEVPKQTSPPLESSRIQISDICPLPKSQVKRSLTRKHKRSDIISSSPYKNEMLRQIEERVNAHVTKKKVLIDEATPSTSKTIQKVKGIPNSKKIKTETTSSKSAGKPKTAALNKGKPKIESKKIWACPGCGEIYKEPIVEDWIQCEGCNEWWHEQCSSHGGSGEFICDLCQD